MLIDTQKLISTISSNFVITQKIMDVMPINIFWKNRLGVYLGCNKKVLEIASFQQKKQFVGKTIYEIMPSKYSKIIDVADEEIMLSRVGKVFEEEWYNEEGQSTIYLSNKQPIFDKNGTISGLLGICIDTGMLSKSSTDALKNLAENIKMELSHQDLALKGIQLTPKEELIAKYVILGKTIRDISNIIHRSPKTVEFHIKNLKRKFNCRTKSKLVEKLILRCLE